MSETGDGAEERSGKAVRTRPSGPLWWPRKRSVALDAGLALLSVLECVIQGMIFAHRSGLPLGPVVSLSAAAGSVLLLRRRWPVAVVLVAVAVLPAGLGGTLVLVGMYTLATTDAPRRLVATLGAMVTVGGTIVLYLALTGGDPQSDGMPWWFPLLVSGMFGVLNVLPPVLLGMYVRARRRLVESLRDRADGLERELSLLADRAEERADWARREERTRIAREMHDVVAHRVSLMVVHAAALQAVAKKDPDKAETNAALVGDMGRQALTELRTMLGVLRSSEDDADEEGTSTPAVRLAEIAGSAGSAATSGDRAGDRSGPGLRELPALVQQSREAGISIAYAEDTAPEAGADAPDADGADSSDRGPQRDYAPEVEATAYRVVQEALTNVHKHAAGAATRVRVARRDDEVAVQVQNDRSDRAVGKDAALPSGGNGLVGMRERVAALGGAFVSGATDEGGFRVSAVIPDTAVTPKVAETAGTAPRAGIGVGADIPEAHGTPDAAGTRAKSCDCRDVAAGVSGALVEAPQPQYRAGESSARPHGGATSASEATPGAAPEALGTAAAAPVVAGAEAVGAARATGEHGEGESHR